MYNEQFVLMNKDRQIALLRVVDDLVLVQQLYTNLPSNMYDVNGWLQTRTSPITRKAILAILKKANIRSKQDYLIVTHGISLNDTFWVKAINEDNLTWEKVSPYRNRFSRIISDMALGLGMSNGNFRAQSPDFSLGGSTSKCWKRVNGQIYMYKTDGEMWSGNNGKNGIRPYCEYYSNQVAQALIDNKSHYITYGLQTKLSEEGYIIPLAISKIFTSEDLGYLAYEDSKYKDNTIEELDTLLTGNNDARIQLREMLLLDSLVLNCDRHMGNYGFLVNNDTFDIVRLAPIFDQDCSLGFNISIMNKENKDSYIEALRSGPRTNFEGYLAQAKWSLTKDLKRRLEMMYPFHFRRLPQNDLSDERISFMEYTVNMQIKRILGR